MGFEFYRLRFSFIAREPVFFPAGQPANILRGALGTVFREMTCAPECPGARACEQRRSCAYARIFEPGAIEKCPSGLADWPRPFVFRARHLDAAVRRRGEPFHFDLHVFELDGRAPAAFALTFAEIGRQGLGPGRGRAELCRVDQVDLEDRAVQCVYNSGAGLESRPVSPARVPLDPLPCAPRRIRVDFLTPTELKFAGQIAAEPTFDVLFARVRDRMGALAALYGSGPLAIDFRALGERAAQVRFTGSETRAVAAKRRSSRTGQTHSIGGFVGWAEYEGELHEFLPFLEAARWTGVGRQTVWGKGEIAITDAGP
jgi:hypothetical protein